MERKLFILLIFFGVTILFVILSSSLVLFVYKSNKYEESINTFFISHYNAFTNKTTFGIVKSPSNLLKNKEFISYQSKNKEIFSVITSKFSTGEFECSGTCFCNDKSSSDRRTVNILSTSLFFIISAFSLSFAAKIATNYFSEECISSLKNMCSFENIESKINFCESSKYGTMQKNEYDSDLSTEELVPKKTETVEKKTETNEIEKKDEYEGMEREYHCEGYCTPNGNLRREESKYECEKFECEKYRQEARVTITETGKLGFIGDEIVKGNMKARIHFEKEYLVLYCRSISKLKYEYVYTNPNGRTQVKRRDINLCVGTNSGKNKYGNICCTLLDPFKTWDGRRERQRKL